MTVPPALRRAPHPGFNPGVTPITSSADLMAGADIPLGLDFSVRRLGENEGVQETHPDESAWILLSGAASIDVAGITAEIRRGSCFDEAPSALHVAGNTPVSIRSLSAGTEFAIVRTRNERTFPPHLFLPKNIAPEYRGAGLVQNAGLRNVRLIFDRAARPESNLVIGEVVNYPGRWSSYPPHHHDQPEIYHYRFTLPSGYGHAELGDDVVKVRDGDTVVIPPGRDHAQVSAPGYGMYYLWMIRHLPGNPYTGFTFAPEHTWTLDPAQQGWRPADLPPGLA